MGVLLERVTYASENSLTLIVDDIMRQHRNGFSAPAAAQGDMESWLNALQRQATPLISSKAGQADLEAWLDAVQKEEAATTAG